MQSMYNSFILIFIIRKLNLSMSNCHSCNEWEPILAFGPFPFSTPASVALRSPTKKYFLFRSEKARNLNYLMCLLSNNNLAKFGFHMLSITVSVVFSSALTMGLGPTTARGVAPLLTGPRPLPLPQRLEYIAWILATYIAAIQSLSPVQISVIPWTAASPHSPSFPIS